MLKNRVKQFKVNSGLTRLSLFLIQGGVMIDSSALSFFNTMTLIRRGGCKVYVCNAGMSFTALNKKHLLKMLNPNYLWGAQSDKIIFMKGDLTKF